MPTRAEITDSLVADADNYPREVLLEAYKLLYREFLNRQSSRALVSMWEAAQLLKTLDT